MDMKATEREADMAHVRAALLVGYGAVLEEWGVWMGETIQVGDDRGSIVKLTLVFIATHYTIFWSHARPRLQYACT